MANGNPKNVRSNFLVLGSGAREHAIADKLLQSDFINKLFLADCNDGFAHLGEKINYTDFENLAQEAIKKNVNILVVGSENPLCEGITDVFLKNNIKVIGVNKHWSQLEASKLFAKQFMQKHAIKTADYKIIKNIDDTKLFDSPYVIKADGLCKGKGVSVTKDKQTALEIIKENLNGKFGEASKTVLTEEFIEGEELSLMSLWDGKSLLSFLPARDFKRLNQNPDSPNTGGMGAFCPVSMNEPQQKKLEIYKNKLENALNDENADFRGFIYSGLIWNEKEQDFYVLEYNVRLGDPETQAILNVLESDFGEILIKASEQNLAEIDLKWSKNTATCLTIAAKGYPQKPEDGKKITNLPQNSETTKIYYAGVKKKKDGLYSNGGRVLSICVVENLLSDRIFNNAIEIADSIEMEGKYYRKDLGL